MRLLAYVKVYFAAYCLIIAPLVAFLKQNGIKADFVQCIHSSFLGEEMTDVNRPGYPAYWSISTAAGTSMKK